MNVSDGSVFGCCCSVESTQFEISGKATLEITKSVLTVATAFTAILGNLLVLISIHRNPLLQTAPNVLLVSLALSDLGVGLVAAPLFLGSAIAKIKEDVGLYCKTITAYHTASFSLCGVSLVTITAIDVERLLAIRLHLRYKELVTVKRVSITCAIIWMLGLLFGALSPWNTTLVSYVSIVVVSFCSVFTAVAYCDILRVVRRHQIQIAAQLSTQVVQQHQGNIPNVIQFKRSSLGMLLVYLTFLLCYAPYVVVKALSYTVDMSGFGYSFDGLTAAFIHINSVLNPLVYCWRFRNIRAAVRATLARLCRRAT